MFSTRMLLPLLLLVSSSIAEARPRHRPVPHHGARPRAHVVINPWAVSYTPAPRLGWLWVAGGYVGPRWRPGYWAPSVPRLGWLWVAGYWTGTVYVDGYWRDEARTGQVWSDGYYGEDSTWIPGYWAPADSADARRDRESAPAPAPASAPDSVFHDYE